MPDNIEISSETLETLKTHVDDGLITVAEAWTRLTGHEPKGPAVKPAKAVVEIFVAMNEDGDYDVATTQEDASERLTDNFACQMIRIVKLSGLMSPPKIAEADVDIPDDTGETIEAEAEGADGETPKANAA